MGSASAPADSDDRDTPPSDGTSRLDLLTSGEMARLSKTTVRTVRFYEETGVLEPASRSEGGHRLFPSSELDKLLFVLDLRGAGLSLEDIKVLLGMKTDAPSGSVASADVSKVLADHARAIEDKIAALTRLHGELRRASEALAACGGCTDDERFPARCHECECMPKAGLPRAIRVLWSVEGDGTGDAP